MRKKFQGLYSDYPGVGIITDEDIYNLVKKHSRLIDRLSNVKMVEMSLVAQCILMKCVDVDPDDVSWKFYGKRSVINSFTFSERLP